MHPLFIARCRCRITRPVEPDTTAPHPGACEALSRRPLERSHHCAGGMSTVSIMYTVAFAVFTPPHTRAASLTLRPSPDPVTFTVALCRVGRDPATEDFQLQPTVKIDPQM